MSDTETYLKDLAKYPSSWITTEGPYAHTVVSSRIRLARNLSGHLFCQRAKPDELERVLEKVISAIPRNDAYNGAQVIRMEETIALDRSLLLERHLISQELAKGGKSRAVVINHNETNGIMINEEDHLRIQVIEPGLALREAWNRINRVDDELEDKLNFAFSNDWGYLTACPTNTGTGMRASVMLHLPALSLMGGLNHLVQKLNQAGLVVRGLYGENSEVMGDLFQFSNQVSLGMSEDDLINNVESYVRQIIGREQNARKQLFREARAKAEDVVYRSYGLLTNARMISANEAMSCLSHLRLGISYGWFDIPMATINKLTMLVQPAHLIKSVGQELDEYQRDKLRADFIRMELTPRG